MKIFTPKNSFKNGEIINVKRLAADHDTYSHRHEFVELVYIRSGKGVHIINDRVYEVTKGDLLFINYSQVHEIKRSDMEFVNILFKPEFMSEKLVNSENIFDIFALERFDSITGEYNGLERIPFRGSELAVIEKTVDVMIEEYEQKKDGYNTVLYGCLQVIFAMMIRKLREHTGAEYSKFVSDITSYIDTHISERITLRDISADCFYNPSYFSRKFKECYGRNLTDYIREKRLEKALELLENTDMTVTDICLDCGFAGKTQFYRLFNDYYGITPVKYRKSKELSPKSEDK